MAPIAHSQNRDIHPDRLRNAEDDPSGERAPHAAESAENGDLEGYEKARRA